MTDPPTVLSAVLTVPEVAALLRVSTWTVGAMVRDGRLPRVLSLRRTRIPRSAVLALLEGGYSDADDEPNGQASGEASASRRGYRRAPDGSLAREAVGSGGAIRRRVGPASGDVVIRRVETRGR